MADSKKSFPEMEMPIMNGICPMMYGCPMMCPIMYPMMHPAMMHMPGMNAPMMDMEDMRNAYWYEDDESDFSSDESDEHKHMHFPFFWPTPYPFPPYPKKHKK